MVTEKEKFRLFAETRRGVHTSLRNNAAAFGYTVVITCTFSMLHSQAGERGLLEIYLFIFGAVVGFGVMEAAVSKLFREPLKREPSDVVALGSTFSIVSISVAVGVAALVARFLGGHVAWVVGAFASTVIYLMLVGVEMAVAQRIQEAREEGSNPD